MREIRTLRATWRGLETWHGRDSGTLADERARQRGTQEPTMQEKQVLERAFAMPLTSPAYPPGPYRFVNREYLIITYRTDPARLRALVPEPLEIDEGNPIVKYEFI